MIFKAGYRKYYNGTSEGLIKMIDKQNFSGKIRLSLMERDFNN